MTVFDGFLMSVTKWRSFVKTCPNLLKCAPKLDWVTITLSTLMKIRLKPLNGTIRGLSDVLKTTNSGLWHHMVLFELGCTSKTGSKNDGFLMLFQGPKMCPKCLQDHNSCLWHHRVLFELGCTSKTRPKNDGFWRVFDICDKNDDLSWKPAQTC